MAEAFMDVGLHEILAHHDGCAVGTIDDVLPMISISWRNIFVDPLKQPPTLGLDFVRAARDTTATTYAVAPAPNNGNEKREATLFLAQNLGKLGLGGVVWDCVSTLQVSAPVQYCTCTLYNTVGLYCLAAVRAGQSCCSNLESQHTQPSALRFHIQQTLAANELFNEC